jgi:hypothetical protein
LRVSAADGFVTESSAFVAEMMRPRQISAGESHRRGLFSLRLIISILNGELCDTRTSGEQKPNFVSMSSRSSWHNFCGACECMGTFSPEMQATVKEMQNRVKKMCAIELYNEPGGASGGEPDESEIRSQRDASH